MRLVFVNGFRWNHFIPKTFQIHREMFLLLVYNVVSFANQFLVVRKSRKVVRMYVYLIVKNIFTQLNEMINTKLYVNFKNIRKVGNAFFISQKNYFRN